jgi:uncharacterized protein (TIGR00369 family)
VSVAEQYKTGVVPLDELKSYDGLSFLKAMIAGTLPQPPMTATLGFRLTEAEHGRAVFTGEPRYEYYNPLGSVHAGFAATLLDSALGCAVHSTLAKGEAYVTAEFKMNLVRPVTKDTGTVTAKARIVHRGRTLGTSEGYLRDAAGKLYAHATTTCIIFPASV